MDDRCCVCRRVPKSPMYVASSDGSVNLVCGVHRVGTVLKAGWRTELHGQAEFDKILKKVPKEFRHLVI